MHPQSSDQSASMLTGNGRGRGRGSNTTGRARGGSRRPARGVSLLLGVVLSCIADVVVLQARGN
jgi:hypothetical protein